MKTNKQQQQQKQEKENKTPDRPIEAAMRGYKNNNKNRKITARENGKILMR